MNIIERIVRYKHEDYIIDKVHYNGRLFSLVVSYLDDQDVNQLSQVSRCFFQAISNITNQTLTKKNDFKPSTEVKIILDCFRNEMKKAYLSSDILNIVSDLSFAYVKLKEVALNFSKNKNYPECSVLLSFFPCSYIREECISEIIDLLYYEHEFEKCLQFIEKLDFRSSQVKKIIYFADMLRVEGKKKLSLIFLRKSMQLKSLSGNQLLYDPYKVEMARLRENEGNIEGSFQIIRKIYSNSFRDELLEKFISRLSFDKDADIIVQAILSITERTIRNRIIEKIETKINSTDRLFSNCCIS